MHRNMEISAMAIGGRPSFAAGRLNFVGSGFNTMLCFLGWPSRATPDNKTSDRNPTPTKSNLACELLVAGAPRPT